jgi:hypothetical protein
MSELPGHVTEPVEEVSHSIQIDAAPARVWELVTALDRYGEWSSENTGGYWRKGEDGEPGTGMVGDMFVGVEWKAPVEIICREEERDFAFVTGGLEYNIALWRYQLEPSGDGTKLTETWTLRKLSPNMIEKGDEELQYRKANADSSIQATLAGMKAAAES